MAAPAPALVRLRTTVDRRWPNRSRASDGWIGDASHAVTGSPENGGSDHNPNSRGLVDALDVTVSGIHRPTLVAALCTHPGTHYVISNRRIYSARDGFRPRVYTGSSPHTEHVHESLFQSTSAEQDTHPWSLILTGPVWPLLRKGATGPAVAELQAYLNAYGASLVVDANFGDATDRELRAFQVRYRVANSVHNGQGDGQCGPATRKALGSS